ncbi:hypothetical protein G6F38_009802 [Rhizopus arrhizus]|nr:hypothetical protein G6F38_009802 [Rhizopus arrhizus]
MELRNPQEHTFKRLKIDSGNRKRKAPSKPKKPASKGTVTGHYMNFIQKTMDEMDCIPEMKGYYIVMDNAPIHIPNEIDTMVTERGYKCIYLPPYSPELNPIEQFWSIVKNKVKRSQFQTKEDLSTRISLLRNLFDDVQIEVLLSNATSRRFRPNTGVLQGSILSPYLYSVYINQLPAQIRPQAFPSSSLPLEMIPSLNCLLYADDVVLIAERSNLVDLLRKCENHSIQMGYKWNSSKCVILDSSTDPITYTLYDQPLSRETTFAYLGVPFKPGVRLDPEELIQQNTQKALATMNILSSVGVNPSGFSKLLCTRFYAHIVRPQLEYGLAINRFTVSQIHALEEAQNNCIKKIYGARGKASTKVMLHMSKLPLLSERVSILQAQFLFRSLYLPEDALLACLLPYIRSTRGSQ